MESEEILREEYRFGKTSQKYELPGGNKSQREALSLVCMGISLQIPYLYSKIRYQKCEVWHWPYYIYQIWMKASGRILQNGHLVTVSMSKEEENQTVNFNGYNLAVL